MIGFNEPGIQYKELYREITLLLHQIGAPAHLIGHDYLRTAIEKAYYDRTYLRNVMSRLYPELADAYHTSVSAVERGMRCAIEIAWMRGNNGAIDSIFGNTVDNMKAKPGNKEFIAMIVDVLKVRNL